MDKKKIIESVLTQIKTHGIADEIVSASNAKKNACNRFERYYDNETEEVVGLVYDDLVILKQTSEEQMLWKDAEFYCKTVVVNGIRAELCPVMPEWKTDVVAGTQDLAAALREIGAENLDSPTWCEAYSRTESQSPFSNLYAWYLRLGANLSNGCKCDYKFYVRPVLRLKKMTCVGNKRFFF